MHGKITYLGNRNPWTDRYKILPVECRPWRNHACQFLWRSVKGFWRDEGSNFGLFHWLASSPLKHSRTTVRVCDSITTMLKGVVVKLGQMRNHSESLFLIFLKIPITYRRIVEPEKLGNSLELNFQPPTQNACTAFGNAVPTLVLPSCERK